MPTKTSVRLCEWLTRAGLGVTEFSKLLDVSQPHTSHVLSGRRSPSLVLAARIQTITGIPAIDWVDQQPIEQPVTEDVEGTPV